MKKLLIATMAAVSVGLCAKAEDTGVISETSFEGLTEGDVFNPTDPDTYWTIPTDTDDVFKITNVTYSADATNQHWDWTENGEKALSIDTANPILRNVNLKDGETGENTAQDVSPDPVFFDSVVQFTATDVAPSMENNTTDKLAVWLYTSPDDVSETNPGLFNETTAKKTLVITAGVLERVSDGDNVVEDVKQKNYDTGIEIEPESWHRLTIKSFLNEEKNKLMFNVWIDGAKDPITAEGVTDFLSLVNPNAESDIKLQGVAFDGKGAVDDIVFTTTDPFYVEVADAKLNITFNDFSAIDVENEAWYQVNDDDVNVITINDALTEATLKAGDKVSVWFSLLEGYELVSPVVEPDEDGFYVITVDALTAEGATIAIVTRKAGGSGVTVDGTPVEFDNDGMIANITTAFDGKAVSGKLDTTKFKSYYTAKVENGILSIKLDQKAAAPFAEATEEKEVLEVGEDASGNPVLTVRIKPYVGLYYGAMTGSALDNLTLTSAGYQEATTDEVIEFTATGKAGDTAGFIKVVVTDIDPEATEE